MEAWPPLKLGAKAHVVAGDKATATATTALNMVVHVRYVTAQQYERNMEGIEDFARDDEVVMSWKDTFETFAFLRSPAAPAGPRPCL